MQILKFDNFNEKQGVIEGLDEIADRIMSRLETTNEYEESVEINGEAEHSIFQSLSWIK